MLSLDEQKEAVAQAALKLPALISRHFDQPEDGPFRALVKQMLPRMRQTPASSKRQYHSAYPGGLLVHTYEVLIVVEGLVQQMKSPNLMRSAVKCAFLHDLGKVGDLSQPYYSFQEDDWRRDRLGEIYTINLDMCYLPVPVRSLWIANQFGVALTPEETQAILASDGPDSSTGRMFGAFQEHPLSMMVHFADKWVSLVRQI